MSENEDAEGQPRLVRLRIWEGWKVVDQQNSQAKLDDEISHVYSKVWSNIAGIFVIAKFYILKYQ